MFNQLIQSVKLMARRPCAAHQSIFNGPGKYLISVKCGPVLLGLGLMCYVNQRNK